MYLIFSLFNEVVCCTKKKKMNKIGSFLIADSLEGFCMMSITFAFPIQILQALEKYKYEQSLDHTSEFIEKLEKELEQFLEHKARYTKAMDVGPQDFLVSILQHQL